MAELVIDTLAPIRRRHDELMTDPQELHRLLEQGSSQARTAAAPVLARARDRFGIASASETTTPPH